jgi:hypothetical protein
VPIFKKITEISNKQPNRASQGLRNAKTNQTQNNRREEITRIRAEGNEIETKMAKNSMKQKDKQN